MQVSAFFAVCLQLDADFHIFLILVDFSHAARFLIRASSPNAMPVQVSAFF